MRGAFRTALACALGLFMIAYVFAVAIHVVPLSAATFEMRKTTDRFLDPLFAQRWSFFAPSPPQLNTETLAQARFFDLADAGVRTTGWLDVSGYLDAKSKQRPLAPSRRYRLAANIERGLLGIAGGRESAERQQFVPDTPTQAESEARRQRLERGYQDLAVRMVTDVLSRQGRHGERLQALQLRVVAIPIPAFGQRMVRRLPPRYLVWESGWREAPAVVP